jgi:mannosyltransferase
VRPPFFVLFGGNYTVAWSECQRELPLVSCRAILRASGWLCLEGKLPVCHKAMRELKGLWNGASSLVTTRPSMHDKQGSGLIRVIACLLVAVLFASLALRIYRLGDQSVWWDEGLAAWAARQSPSAIAEWTSSDVHPPLYFWVLHYWRLLVGETEFGLRALSALVGVLTVAASYRIGLALDGRLTGLGAALLTAISRFDIQWSQEMRMYALAALLAILSLWAAIRFWRRQRWVDAAAYVLLTAAGLYTLYLYALVLVVANLVWLGTLPRAGGRARRIVWWAGAQVAVLILFAPWLAYALRRMPTWSSASPVSVNVFLRIYWTVLTVGNPTNVEQYAWLTVPLLIAFSVGLMMLLWRGLRDGQTRHALALLLVAVLLPAGIVYLVSLPRSTFFYAPQLAPRYLLLFAPAFYVLTAWGAAALGQRTHRTLGIALLAAFGAAAIYGLSSYYPGRILHDDYISLAATLRAYEQEDDAVLLYTDRDWPIFAYHYAAEWQKIPYAQSITPQWAEGYLPGIWEQHEGIWLVVTPYAGINDPQGCVPRWLEQHALAVDEHRFSDKVLRLYARTEERANTLGVLGNHAPMPRALGGKLTPNVRLVGYEKVVDTVLPGDTVHVFLHWQRGGESGTPPHFKLTLLDQTGLVLKEESTIVPEPGKGDKTVRQQVDAVVPPDTPRGRYRLVVRSPDGRRVSDLGDLYVVAREAATMGPDDVTIPNRYEVTLDGGVRLLGYDIVPTTASAGDTVQLALYWQADAPIEQRYKVFTHVLGDTFSARTGSFLWGQQDNEPVSDTRPTPTWRTGEVIVDRYAIPIDSGAPTGTYTVEIGMYEPATGIRLPVLGRDGKPVADHVVLLSIRVTSG